MRRRRAPDDADRTFEEILDRYEKRIFNLAKRLLGDRDEASDVTQETFLKAYRAMNRFRRDSNPYTWLSKIAVNTCRNRFRQRDRRRKYEGVSYEEDVGGGAGVGSSVTLDGGAAAETPHGSLQRRELNEKIAESLDSLSDEHRIAVVLRDFEGLSYREIAVLTGETIENVKTRIFRGRLAMRNGLMPYLTGTDG